MTSIPPTAALLFALSAALLITARRTRGSLKGGLFICRVR